MKNAVKKILISGMIGLTLSMGMALIIPKQIAYIPNESDSIPKQIAYIPNESDFVSPNISNI